MEKAYHSKKVREFLGKEGIFIFTMQGDKNQNQVSESRNNRIKYLLTKIFLEHTNLKAFRAFNKTLPDSLRSIRLKDYKCRNKEYRQYLFESNFFNNQRQKVIQQAVLKYNKTYFSKGITRQEANYFNSFIKGQNIKNTQLVTSDHFFAEKINSENVHNIILLNK